MEVLNKKERLNFERDYKYFDSSKTKKYIDSLRKGDIIECNKLYNEDFKLLTLTFERTDIDYSQLLIPKKVTTIYIGDEELNLDKLTQINFPENVKYIKIDFRYYRNNINYIKWPKHLKIILLSNHESIGNIDIINTLPNSVEVLELPIGIIDFVPIKWPTSIRKVIFNKFEKLSPEFFNSIPDSVEIIKLPLDYNFLSSPIIKYPTNLKKLFFLNDYYTWDIIIKMKELYTLNIPENTKLHINEINNNMLDGIPNYIKNLRIDHLYRPLTNLPICLEKLTVYDTKSNREKIESSKIPFGCIVKYKKI